MSRRANFEDAIRRLVFQRSLKPRPCQHIDDVIEMRPDGEACSDCVTEGTRTVHLRKCMTCGHVACCDSSRPRHARRHHEETGHPLIRSIEPGESWVWCYPDSSYMSASETRKRGTKTSTGQPTPRE